MSKGAEKIDWAGFIADIEAKITALQALLGSLKSAQALGALGQPGEFVQGSYSAGTVVTPGVGGTIDLPAGAFLGKSLATAIELYLQAVRSKKTTKDIAQALKEGGVESMSSKFESVVAAKLIWLKGTGKVLKMQDGSWALSEWYPAGFRATLNPPQGKPKAKKRERKRKTEVKAKENKETHQGTAEIKQMPVAS
ncbi:MAG: hypothetical protein L0387_17850 [Acidobacteria bacterium]|nr:hypothetical protein [Acidobacteriota bacterium]MCI0719544.1 hypothetical protein [Acidobacteriota bacterium]